MLQFQEHSPEPELVAELRRLTEIVFQVLDRNLLLGSTPLL